MRVDTGRAVGRVWLLAGIFFAVCVWIVRSFGQRPETQRTGLWVGYLGLAAIGVALFLTFRWTVRGGPPTVAVRAAILILLAVAFALWVLALEAIS